MKAALTFLACLCVIALAVIEFPSGTQAVQRPAARSAASGKPVRQRFVPGEVLVRYRSEALAQAKTGRIVVAAPDGDLVAGQVERNNGSNLIPGYRLVRVPSGDTLKAVAALRKQPDVLHAEPNYLLHADAVPNDEHFLAGRQYGLARIGAQQVWDNFNTGSPSVVVAVIDMGIKTTHPDLAANIWTNPAEIAANGVDDDGNGFVDDIHGFNFLHDTEVIFSDTEDETHATHVAGILGAVGNNSKGISGVNWSVRMMSLKFLNELGDGDTDDAIQACDYAKQMRDLWESTNHAKGANVRVINASFGGTEFSQQFAEAINRLNGAGILFVAAAGNIDNGMREPNNGLIPHFPGNYDAPNIISVASTNQTDNLSSFSHFGSTTVDIGAPGEDILSTTPPCQHPGPFPDFPCEPSFPVNFLQTQADTYSFFSGTSMAAPHVSGAAALLWTQNPNLTVQQVRNLIMLNGDVRPALVDKTLTARRLNVANSFQAFQETDNTAPGAVTNFHVNFQNGRTINLGWTSSGDDAGGGGAAALYELSLVEGAGPTEKVIPLKGVAPTAPGTAQSVAVTIPYRHLSGNIRLRVFDNKGNEGVATSVPVSVSLLDGDPYVPTVGPPAPLTTGGFRLEINGDDRYDDFLFPPGFTFPFFGTTFTGATISSNGNLFFSTPPKRQNLEDGDLEEADDPPGSPKWLGGHQMIAGLWQDLDVSIQNRTDAGVYFLQPSPTRIIFRWQGEPCNFSLFLKRCAGGDPVNFEIELRTDGTIKTRYGAGNLNLLPTVGIGGGDQDGYAIPSHTSEDEPLSLTNAEEVTYTPRAQWNQTVLTGPQVELKTWTLDTRTYSYVKLNFPDAGFRVNNWGTLVQAGNAFSVDATVERFTGAPVQATSSTAQIYELGILAPGNYTFTFRTSGTSVKTLNFTVSASPPPANPIDDAREFVRWQYKDFLRREPDGPGWDHWTGEITECTDVTKRRPGETEPQCVDRKRTNTSAAFFLSPEFQNTGYFVLRVYRGSLGRMPHFGGTGSPNDEFTRDAGTISQGIVVNDALAPAVINANKQAFVHQFVTRAEFRAIYDALNNTQYVDRLFLTTGVMPSAADRSALINGLTAGTESRASVLFKVVDGTTTTTGGLLTFNTTYGKAFYDSLFNAAFVQMEYFGYLLRDPDDGGFAFWLGKLNHFGNFVDAEMVRAFIRSPEYRSRFGQP